MNPSLEINGYVKYHFDGILIIGDVHADYASFSKAVQYAKENNFFLVSLGDLVDRGSEPFEVVSEMAKLIYDGRAAITIGNHDDKLYRYHKGNKVLLSTDAQRTLDIVDNKDEFLNIYSTMLDDKIFSAYYHVFDDFILTHAASHPSMWDGTEFDKSAKFLTLFGETTGKTDIDGIPERLYNWVNEIPSGKTVIVGHDRKPIFNKQIFEPLVQTNNNDGKVIFLDTGCGKNGFLSSIVLMQKNKRFEIIETKEFK